MIEGEGRRRDDRADERLARAFGERRRVDRPRCQTQPALAHGRRPSPSRSGSVASGTRLEGESGRCGALLVGVAVADVERSFRRDSEPLEREQEHVRIGLRRSRLGGADDLGEVRRRALPRSRWPAREMSQFETHARARPAWRSRSSASVAPVSGRKTMPARNAGANAAGSRSARACSRKTPVQRCAQGRRGSPRPGPRGCGGCSRRPRP